MVKTLFIISPIGDEGSVTRNYFDKVRRNIIDPIAKELEYQTLRADDIHEPGQITKQIIEKIIESDLVVADLSEKNPNVFYELAVRHAVVKPVILLGKINEDIPFDVAAQRVIRYDFDPDNVRVARESLRAQMNAVESKDFWVETPIETILIKDQPDRSLSKDEEDNLILTILRNQSQMITEIISMLNKIMPEWASKIMPKLASSDYVSASDKILSYLNEVGLKSINEISDTLNIPPRTVRPVLRRLLVIGDVKYVHTDPGLFYPAHMSINMKSAEEYAKKLRDQGYRQHSIKENK